MINTVQNLLGAYSGRLDIGMLLIGLFVCGIIVAGLSELSSNLRMNKKSNVKTFRYTRYWQYTLIS